MSYKKRTYDTDEITLRKVFAKSSVDNTNIPAMRVLTADGAGSSYWAVPSTLGMNPSFNQVNTSAGNFVSDLSYNILTITANNIGVAQGPGTNNLVLYNQSFNEIDVSGNNTLRAFNSNTSALQPALKFTGVNGITVTSDSATNTIFFDSIGIPVSTGLYSFQKAKIISNVSTMTGNISSLEATYLNAASPSSALTFVGLGDLDLFTDNFNNAIYFGLNQSTGSVSTLTADIYAISTGYVTNQQFSTGIAGVSTIGYSNFSTSMSTSYGINSNLSITVYNLPFNNYTLLAQYNAGRLVTESAISSLSTNYTPLPALFSTSAGINARVTTFNLVSSVSTIYVYGGTVTGFTASNLYYMTADVSTLSTSIGGTLQNMSITTATLTSQVSTLSSLTIRGLSSLSTAFFTTLAGSLTSTVVGLGTSGYISSASLYSTVRGLGTAGYLSSSSLYSTVAGLGTAGYLSSSSLYSTVTGLGTAGYISSASLYSTVQGLRTSLSTNNFFVVSTGSLITSSILFRDTALVNTNQLLAVKNGQLQLNGNAITGGGGSGIQYLSTSFTSTIYYSGSNGSITANPITDCNISYQGEFTSAEVKFDTFSTYITSTAKICIDYYYNIRLPIWSYGVNGSNSNVNDTKFSFSTGVLYNNILDYSNVITDIGVSQLPSNTYVTQTVDLSLNIVPTSNTVYYNTVISRLQHFQLNTINIITNYTSPLKIYHIIDSFYNNGDGSTYFYSGFSNYNILFKANSTTALSISIQN